MAIEPVTREERFLAAAGGQSVTPPEPITRKEQLLQGIIDAVKSGGANPDVIEGAVNDYLNANPVQPGATTEQAAQIEQNKNDIADLQTEVDELKESGGNGSGQNPPQDGENGATFTPTVSADGTLSWSNDKGLDNPAPVNIKGPKGVPGDDGYTPKRKIDYWTDEDQEAIVQQVIAALGTPVFGRVDMDKNIDLTGDLADGVYTFRYVDKDGNKTVIGTLTKTNDSPYVELEWEYNTKIDKATGATASANDYHASWFVPYNSDYTYQLTATSRNSLYLNPTICWYDANKNFLGWNHPGDKEISIQNAGSDWNSITSPLVPMPDAAFFRVRLYSYNFDDTKGVDGGITIEKQVGGA